MKTLQELKDIIWRKAEVNEEYLTADDIKFDLNQEYKILFNIASATGKGITRKTEEVTLNKNTKEYTRQNKGDEIIKVEIKQGTNGYKCIDFKKDCTNNCNLSLGVDYDYQKIYVDNPKDDYTLRLTYLHEDFTQLENDTDVVADWLKDFDDLLWLAVVMEQVALYKPERYEIYMKQYDRLFKEFEKRFPLKQGKVSFEEKFNY